LIVQPGQRKRQRIELQVFAQRWQARNENEDGCQDKGRPPLKNDTQRMVADFGLLVVRV
jgi:hypothetical protein